MTSSSKTLQNDKQLEDYLRHLEQEIADLRQEKRELKDWMRKNGFADLAAELADLRKEKRGIKDFLRNQGAKA